MTRAWSEAAIPGLTGITAVVTEASGGIGLQVTRGLARPSQQRHNRKQLRQHCTGSQTRGSKSRPPPARVSWVAGELRSLRFPSPNSRLCAAVAGALADRNPSRSRPWVISAQESAGVLCAVRCRLHAAGSRLPGPRYGLGLLLSDLLQVCMPVRLILVQGPGDCRRLLLSYLRLSLGQPGLGPGGPGPCGLGL
jgi:hypothetical protein